MESTVKVKKAKLPRKRKKQAIKAQGRKWYYDTIRLHKVVIASGKFYEPVCKFWVNSSVIQTIMEANGKVIPTLRPTRYW